VTRVLLISVRFHDGRYHGAGDWPPSPARLFQALVAGIGRGGPLDQHQSEPLEWLEGLRPPLIAAPRMIEGQKVENYVPKNDLDAVGGDARRIGSIRTPKVWKPKLFDPEVPLLYAWTFDDDERTSGLADRVCRYSEALYQLGRGVDQAWACGEILDLGKWTRGWWIIRGPSIARRAAARAESSHARNPNP
jgi:CRISPR-associated protein Csb2